MVYIGGISQSHSQDAGKVAVNDFGLGATSPVFIVVSDKLDLNNDKNRIWFLGTVNLDGTFDIDADNAGKTTLSGKTFVQFFADDSMNILLQAVEFHTSCSQPLFIGDQFGGVQLTGYTDVNGAVAALPPRPAEDAHTLAETSLVPARPPGSVS